MEINTYRQGGIKSASMDLEEHCTDDVVCTKETFAALVCRDVRAVLTRMWGLHLSQTVRRFSSIHSHSSETGFLSHSYHSAFAENHLLFAFRGGGVDRETRSGRQSKVETRYQRRGKQKLSPKLRETK